MQEHNLSPDNLSLDAIADLGDSILNGLNTTPNRRLMVSVATLSDREEILGSFYQGRLVDMVFNHLKDSGVIASISSGTNRFFISREGEDGEPIGWVKEYVLIINPKLNDRNWKILDTTLDIDED